jgi:hypothetical protein
MDRSAVEAVIRSQVDSVIQVMAEFLDDHFDNAIIIPSPSDR